ncbi:MAG: hypothetical protein Greene07147_54 [Parcubacteria group bacterium Greene0714_7]|nr:MAG: hypothetical protein Greene07147_54 [Parcubacteria group bacterium Greene0714_7]
MSEAYFDPSTTPLGKEEVRGLAQLKRGFKRGGALRNSAATAIRAWCWMRDKK